MNAQTEKAQHTAEPWHVTVCYSNKEDGAFYLRGPAVYSQVGSNAAICKLDGPSSILDEANAKRIIACVNACQGIPDPASALPALVGALENIAENAERVADDYTTLEGLRTELRGFSELARHALAQGGKR